MRRISALIQVVSAVMLGLTPTQFVVEAQRGNPIVTPNGQQAQHQTIDDWITDQVKQSHGDWIKDRYSFYMGFCTAGIKDDAAPAIAMRRQAFTLMNRSLAAGDKLTPFAFEMNVYKIGDAVTLTPKESSRSQFVSEVRRTPMPNSKGGHDIERSLYDILESIRPAERASTIILLWNKDNASQDPDGQKVGLFSEDNPNLQKAITTGNYRNKLVRSEFPVQSDSKNVSVSITALFPSRLVSLDYGKKTPRYPTFAPDTWQPPSDAPGASEQPPNHDKHDSTVPLGLPTNAGQRSYLWWTVTLAVTVIAFGLLLVAVRKHSGTQRPRPSVAASATPAAAKLETIPGSLRMTIGPDEQTTAPLAKNSNWTITKGGDGKFILTDISNNTNATSAPATTHKVAETAAPPAVASAFVKLSFANSTALLAEADSGAQFTELQGTAANQSDSRTLKIEPGKRVLCRIQPPDASSKIRLEIVYNTRDQKAGGA